MKSKTNKLLIISGYLYNNQTIGGVTMHVHRLIKRLIEPHVKNYDLCDYKVDGLCKQLRKIKKSSVMHIHASNPFLKLFYVIVGKLYKTSSLVMVHGKYGIFSSSKNFIHRIALKWCDVPILINRESYEAIVKINPNAVLIPAFIPPIEEEEYLSSKIERLVYEIKKNGKPLFVTNASSRAFTDDGKEVYGIDFLVNYFKKHKEYNLIILDPHNDYYPLCARGISENIRIINGNNSFCALVKLSDVVVRNTPIDGDSFSVKEALYFHKPIIATDAVSRPKGVILFKYCDTSSFEDAIETSLSHKEEFSLIEKDATEIYFELYHQFGVV